MEAAVDLVTRLGGEIFGLAFLVELLDLKGREKLKNYDIRSLIQY
jgi:adenine phosphoribosyltransferase